MHSAPRNRDETGAIPPHSRATPPHPAPGNPLRLLQQHSEHPEPQRSGQALVGKRDTNANGLDTGERANFDLYVDRNGLGANPSILCSCKSAVLASATESCHEFFIAANNNGEWTYAHRAWASSYVAVH